MSFQWPLALLALALVPLLVAAYVWAQRRRSRYAIRYASLTLVREAVGKGPGIRRHIPAAVYLTALTAMIVALARPEATLSLPKNQGTVVLAVDISGSMLATDVEPNRIEATKRAVREFVKKQPDGVQIGIVSFSDFGLLVQAPTRDKDLVVEAIERLRAQRGTNIGGGLQVALDAIYEGSDTYRPGAAPPPSASPGTNRPAPPAKDDVPRASIVLMSDGQSTTGPPPLDVADEAVRAGIRVYTVGIGTTEGAVLNIQGRSVFTRLDEETLKKIAELTGAKYYQAEDADELTDVYRELARERQFEKEKTEVTFAVTAGALVLSLIGGVLSLFWFNRLP